MPKAVSRKDSKGRVLRTGESEVLGKGYKYRYTDLYGERQTVYAPNLVLLRQKEENILADLRDGINSKDKNIVVNKLFEKHMDSKTNLKASTRKVYKDIWHSWFFDSPIGRSPVCKLRKSDIKQYYADMHRKGLKNATILTAHRLLHSVIQIAVDDELIRKNVCDDCAKDYTQAETAREAMTKEQQKIYVNFIKTSLYSKYLPLITFLLGTGCRISEALGLTWDDIDFTNNVIHIGRQLKCIYDEEIDKYTIDTPKSKFGIRNIPLKPEVREQLLIQKQNTYFLSMGSGCVIDGYKGFVFVNKHGYVLNASVLYHTFKAISMRIRKQGHSDFPIVSAHILRHTACTRMAERKMDMKALQKIMGHSDIELIMKVYYSVQEDKIEEEMEKVGDIVNL